MWEYGCVRCRKYHREDESIYQEHIYFRSKHGPRFVPVEEAITSAGTLAAAKPDKLKTATAYTSMREQPTRRWFTGGSAASWSRCGTRTAARSPASSWPTRTCDPTTACGAPGSEHCGATPRETARAALK